MSDEREYWRKNRILMSVVGAWPYQSRVSTWLAYIFYVVVAGSQFYCKIAYVRMKWPDPIVLVECMTPIMYEMIGFIKLLNLIINTQKIKKMLDQIIGNKWPPKSPEFAIIESYNRSVEKITTIWTYYVYTTLMLYNLMPLIPQILGTLGNETRQLQVPVYYHTDIEDYYYPVFAHGFVSGCIFTAGIIAADTIFVLFVQYACALFAVLGHKLRNGVTEIDENSDLYPRKCDDATYKNFSDCIEHYTKAIEFSEMIESSHKLSFLFLVALDMLIISFTGAQMLQNLDEVHLLFRQSAVLISLMTHLFIENYYSQRLLDHSLTAYSNILECNWYRASIRTKKLLILLILRSRQPSTLTIGGIYVMSMETFSLVLRTSASYFTILLSMQ